ncbi:MAG: PAS domain-containing protein [Longimicrobiales bacterium]|nr:PAS domain-containing protein [Longimicrobiales bacterium]
MQRVCAWCGNDLDDPGVRHEPDAGISHGVCPTCYDRLTDGMGIPILEFLDSLDQPAFLMDADHTIGMANAEALELFGRRAGQVVGRRTGEVFDCENAHLPGGCGRTIHCSGCTIRQAVARTHLSGEPQLGVPATLRVIRDAAIADAELSISTIRVGDRVLLRVERFER